MRHTSVTSVTLDTNILPGDDLIAVGRRHGHCFAVVSVTEHELQEHPLAVTLHGLGETISELGVWNESLWGAAVWANEESAKLLDGILTVISDGSFPKDRATLSHGQRRQLRDAMILEAHTRARRDCFVTNDAHGFVFHGKREKLEALCGTSIRTAEEYLQWVQNAG
jgi:hypothetical protein